MKKLRQVLRNRKTVYITALIATSCLLIAGTGLWLNALPTTVSWTFFTIATFSVFCSWVSHVYFGRISNRKVLRAEIDRLSREFTELETYLREFLSESMKEQVIEQRTASFHSLLSLQDVQDTLIEEFRGKNHE